MKRAVIYARVSSRRQADDGISIEAQIEQCTKRAALLDATVVRVFRDEGISGRSIKGRVGFQSALEYCEAASVDYFIVWSTSRFARNAVDLWVYHDQLKDVGTRLECLNADIDDETDSGFINRVFMGAMDQLVSRQIARDTLRSMKQSAADGYFTGGRVPFGYRVVNAGKRRRLEEHPHDAMLVRLIFDLSASGLGMQAVALKLNEGGYLHNGKRWGKTSVNYVLRNELYTGVKVFNRKSRKTGQDKPEDEWVRVEGQPAIVKRDVFEKVKTMLDTRAPVHKAQGGAARSVFLFTGLLKCGVCGDPLQIVNGTGRGGRLYSYYGCLAHRKGAVRCLFRNVRADLFDDWLLDEILTRVLTVDVMVQTMQELADRNGQWARQRQMRRQELVKELRSLEARRGNLYDLLELHGRGAPDLSDLSERLRLRNAEIKAVQDRLEKLENEEPQISKAAKVDPAVAVEVMREVVMTGDTQKKRAFLGAFLESVTVSAERVDVEYQPESLVQIGHSNGVRSEQYWLPVEKSLRTRVILIPRTESSTNQAFVGASRA